MAGQVSWTLANFSDLASGIQSIVTPIGLIVAGVWAYRKYVLEESRYPHIETAAEIEFIGQQANFWIVELRAILVNKGKVQHKIKNFGFVLDALYGTDKIDTSKKWGGQVNFPKMEAKGSFLPKSFEYFTVGPSVTAKYSYIARVSKNATFLLLHCEFDYSDDRGFSHSMERSVAVPRMKLPSA